MAFYFGFRPKLKYALPLFAVVFIGAGVAFAWFGPEKWQTFLDFAERSSTGVRLQVYEVSFSLIAKHPFLGHGLGQYEYWYRAVAPEVLGQAPYEWVMIHPHNLLLAVWLNLGLLGVFAFVGLIIQASQWLKEKKWSWQRIGFFMLLMILVHGMVDTPYFKNDLAFEFWLLLAILL